MSLTDNDTMFFGKHQGKKMSEVPIEYLEWYVKAHCRGALAKISYTQQLIRKYIENKQKPL